MSSKDILTSASPTMMTSNANSESSTVPNPTMTHLHPMSITSLSFVQSDTLDTVLDEIIIDEEDYYTDGTSDSDVSSKDSVEGFEL